MILLFGEGILADRICGNVHKIFTELLPIVQKPCRKQHIPRDKLIIDRTLRSGNMVAVIVGLLISTAIGIYIANEVSVE
ncbi:hypothetical protein [Caldibacillus debilis]|uniref:hypothetical protein n=1 Tax=Caldibacillus debilis TaxID=301148 RepID=UPI000366B99F|nr:hypothetical protein [Caldibacillus debilis]